MAESRALGAIVPVAARIDYYPVVLSGKPFATTRLNIQKSVTRQLFARTSPLGVAAGLIHCRTQKSRGAVRSGSRGHRQAR